MMTLFRRVYHSFYYSTCRFTDFSYYFYVNVIRVAFKIILAVFVLEANDLWICKNNIM